MTSIALTVAAEFGQYSGAHPATWSNGTIFTPTLYFAPSFFPNGNQTTQLLQTAAVFAIGFLMRPIGGYVFGFIADKYGRKNSMMISVLMMCAGSLAIAVLPTYAMIGTAAPVLLLLARMLQGLSVGGEYGTSATYMSEVALPGKRGFYASFQCNADRRPVAGFIGRAYGPAVSHRWGIACVGLAHTIFHWCGFCNCRVIPESLTDRDFLS
jgi:MFS family permease